ncbi:MAG: cytochrome C [Deltaproteobacteria bacterium]|nr:cytochrome C [Deltaproteobacteria bacterium]
MLASAPAAAADEVRYSTHIRPIFEQKCAPCHGGDAPELGEFNRDKERYQKIPQGPKMDTHAHLVHFTGWPDTGALMRRLDDGKGKKDGKPGNMHQYLGADDAERRANLALFRAWVGNWTLKRLPELTKEELAAIRVKY